MTTTTTTATPSFLDSVVDFFTPSEETRNVAKSVASDVQNIGSESIKTVLYTGGSVTRSASTLATATRMGSEYLYNALPSDREAVESKITELAALTSALTSTTDNVDTQEPVVSNKSSFGKVQPTQDIS